MQKKHLWQDRCYVNVSDIQFRGDGENVFTIGQKEEFCIEVSYCNTTITFSISFIEKKEPTIGFIGLENSILLKFYYFSVVQKCICTFECSTKVKDLGKNKIFQKHMAYNLHILKIASNTLPYLQIVTRLRQRQFFSTYALRTLQLILWPKKGAKYKDLDFAFTSSEVKLEFSSFLQKWLAN